jgi:excisionase family DNA binding protein
VFLIRALWCQEKKRGNVSNNSGWTIVSKPQVVYNIDKPSRTWDYRPVSTTERTPEIMTPDQAAAYLQVDRETIYRYIRAGKLDASRLGRSYRIPRRNIELLLLATRTRPYIRLRDYTPGQIEAFRRADVLDGEALAVARQFDEATGGRFFQDEEGADKADRTR